MLGAMPRSTGLLFKVNTGLREKGVVNLRCTGRPSVDPELMIRTLLVSYCFGIPLRTTIVRIAGPAALVLRIGFLIIRASRRTGTAGSGKAMLLCRRSRVIINFIVVAGRELVTVADIWRSSVSYARPAQTDLSSRAP